MSHIEEKGFRPVTSNEVYSLFGVSGCKIDLVLGRDLLVNDLITLNHWQVGPTLESFFHWEMPDARMVGPHVIGVR